MNESHGGLSGLSPLGSYGSYDSQAGRLDCESSGQHQRQTKRDYWGLVHSDRWFLGSQVGEAERHEHLPKDIEGKPKKQGGLPDSSLVGSDGLVVVRQGGWTA